MLVKSECATSGQKNKIKWVFNFYQMNNLHNFITITNTMVHESAGVIFEYSELSEELGLHSKFSVCLKSGRDERICDCLVYICFQSKINYRKEELS